MARWEMFTRAADYTLTSGLPIISVDLVDKHLGVPTAVVSTGYSEERWAQLDKGCGLVIQRDGVQQFAGLVSSRQFTWDAESGRATIKVNLLGDLQHLADRITFPDPLRAPDDQTVNDRWTFTGVASTAMLRLISDQAGATCRSDRRVPGITLGADPVLGASRAWTGLIDNVLTLLGSMSVASGANLGLRTVASQGGIRVDVLGVEDLSDTVKFSADLSNLVGIEYTETAPTATHVVAAGQGDLHLRIRKFAETVDPDTLAWGRQVWSYVDDSSEADGAKLLLSAQDKRTEGAPTVNLTVTLTDSQAATYDRDWGLGNAITVYVGLPGSTKVATVSDVVREIKFSVNEAGVEKITPAIGTYDAKAVIPTPTQQKLAEVGRSLSGLITRK